jgi:hypothetical protein
MCNRSVVTARLALWTGFTVVMLGITTEAPAQESMGEACRPALMKDYTSTIRSDQQKISWFLSIDESTYEKIKHEAGFKVGLPIPVVGDIIGMVDASANYADFAEKRTEYLKKEGYVSDSFREERDLRIVTSPVAYSAWSKCIEAFARQSKAVTLYKDQEDAQTVRVMILNGTPAQIRVTSELINGSVSGQRAGKAFRDGKKIDGGGAFPVLIRRNAGDGKLKLSISALPMWDIPPVESEWSSTPKEQLRGTLKVKLPDPKPQDRGNNLGETKTWPDMHNEKCKGRPVCSNDGKWLATEQTLNVGVAKPEYLLEAVWYECVNGACEWNAGQRKECRIADGRKTGSCTIVAGSAATTYRIWGKQIEYDKTVLDAPPVPILLFGKNQQFTLTVPKKATSAVFEYSNDAGTGALTPGDATSGDGRIVLVSNGDGNESSIYTYRHQ